MTKSSHPTPSQLSFNVGFFHVNLNIHFYSSSLHPKLFPIVEDGSLGKPARAAKCLGSVLCGWAAADAVWPLWLESPFSGTYPE